MSEKKAFVFDTNFIIQIKTLDEVVANLSDRFIVYITQVSIDERIAQVCRETKDRFERLKQFESQYKDIVEFQYITTYDKMESYYKDRMQRKYEELFKDHVVPFSKDEKTFNAVLERANKKAPPFIQGSSDKGFKDALLWESLLEYFKESTVEEVVFLSDDGGFIKNTEVLCEEFESITGKRITIYQNSFYTDLTKTNPVKEELPIHPKKPVDLEKLREEIRRTITNLCVVTVMDGYYDQYEFETFTINKEADADYIADIFSQMEAVYTAHFLETELDASYIFNTDGRVTNGRKRIPINAVEEAIELWKEIKSNNFDLLTQFYNAAAAVVNQNYTLPITAEFELLSEDDTELPF